MASKGKSNAMLTGLVNISTDGRSENDTEIVYNLAGNPVLVYGVPVLIAKWIAESLYDLDYIQVSDVADLATFAARYRRMDQELFEAAVARLESEHAMFGVIDGDANIDEYLGPSSSW